MVTQVLWGVVNCTDGVAPRLFPLVWEPNGWVTGVQYDLIFLCSVGFGILIGEAVGGVLADRFGRRPVILASVVIEGAFLFPVAFTHQVGALCAWVLLSAIGLGMLLATNAVYLHEVVPHEVRHKVALRAQIVGICIYLLLPGLLGYYLLPHQDTLFVVIIAIVAFVVGLPLAWFRLPESPRWLAAHGRIADAERIVVRWERRLGVTSAPGVADTPEPEAVQAPENKAKTSELFVRPLRRRTITLWIGWFFGYAGIIYAYVGYSPAFLVDRGWSSHQLFIVTTIVAAPLCALSLGLLAMLNDRVERRTLIMIAGLIGGVAALLLIPVTGFTGSVILISLVTPFSAIPWVFNMYNYTALAYPTRVRAIGTGWTDGVGHLGSVLAPVVAGTLFSVTAAHEHYAWLLWLGIPGAILPGVVIGVFGMRQRGKTLEELAS